MDKQDMIKALGKFMDWCEEENEAIEAEMRPLLEKINILKDTRNVVQEQMRAAEKMIYVLIQ